MARELNRILGIDPGFGRIGWGVIEGSHHDWRHVAHGCIETSTKKDFPERLVEIREALIYIVGKYQPNLAGVEELFFNTNITTAMKVSQARGVILLTLIEADIKSISIKPAQLKSALTGYGKAEKSQIQKMVQLQLNLKKKPSPDDAADALAVALTCGFLT